MREFGGLHLDSMTLWDLAVERANQTPNALLAVSEGGSDLSFVQLRDRAAGAASWLQRSGVGQGENVVWQFPTSEDALVIAVALSRLGAIQIPILPFLGRRELGHVLHQTRAPVLVVPTGWGAGNHEERDFVSSEFGHVRILQVPSELSGTPAIASSALRGEAHSWVFYTSGTTGAPKGARHSEATLIACASAMVDRYEVTAADRMAFVFQVTHIGGIAWIYAALLAGCRLLLIEKFNRAAVWSLRRHGVTMAGAGLPFMHEYLAAQRTLPEGEQLFPTVRVFTFGGMPKPPSIHYEIKRECGGAGVLGSYGMTEAPIVTAAGPALSDEELANTEGPPMPGVDLRIVRDDGELAANGESGEIRIKAPQVMMGYLDPEMDVDVFDEAGFLRSGDLGHLDQNGNVVISGRLKDVIIRKGENVSVKEVEDALFTHPRIEDVCVVGIPDELRGEMVCAVVVTADRSMDVTAIAKFLGEFGLMRQKIPERVELVDALPRSPFGKVDRQELRERLRNAGS